MAKKIPSINISSAFQRTKAIPLDNRSLYDTYEEALLYAQTGKTAYVGQIISVNNNGESTVYKIDMGGDGVKFLTPFKDNDTTNIKTDKFIDTKGGPLADAASKVYPNGIPEGTSVQDIFMKLFCKELWSSTPSLSYNFSVSVGKPICLPYFNIIIGSTESSDNNTSYTIKEKTFDDVDYEIGAYVTISAITMPVTNVLQNLSLSPFEYGYKLDDENSDKINSKIYQQNNFTPISNDNSLISLSLTGISGDALSGKTLPIISRQITSLDARINVNVTGVTFTADSNVEEHTFYLLTNLSNTYNQDKNGKNSFLLNKTLTPEWNEGLTYTPINSIDIKLNVYRKSYLGYFKNYDFYKNEGDIDVKTMNYSNYKIIKNIKNGVYELTTKNGARQIVFAYPSGSLTLRSVVSTSQLGAEIGGNFVKYVKKITSANNFDSVDYDVWVWTPAKEQDADTYIFKID